MPDRNRQDGTRQRGDSEPAPERPAEAIEMPIDGILDLHTFRPQDARAVVGDYLDACRERGLMYVRIIHGKGTGRLRETVHSVLRQRPDVVDFRLASDASGWGATLVTLSDRRSPAP